MNEETKERIQKEAEEKYPLKYTKNRQRLNRLHKRVGYIAGATAEHKRSKALYDCLKLIREMPEGVWFAKTIDKALEKYDNSK